MTIETQPPLISLAGNTVYALQLAEGGVLLVDAGPDVEGTWDEAVALLDAYRLTPADVRAVLVTHAHIDHAGLAARWVTAGARVLAGAADVRALAGGRAWLDARLPLHLDTLRRHGAPIEVWEAQAEQASRRAYRWTPCPTVETVADGTTFPLAGGTTLRVIDAPGHTPGNLVAYIEATGDLYSGDTLIDGVIPTPGLHFPQAPDGGGGPRWPSLPPFRRSVARLRALGARRVLPGHGNLSDDPARLIERFEAHHARRAERMRALLAEQPDSAYGLAKRMFPRIGPLQLAQAMTEAIGHFDALLGTGEALREEESGVVRFRLA